jgi:hypothetical protein
MFDHPPRTPDDFEMIHRFASSTVTGSRGGLLGAVIGGTTEYNVWDQMPPAALKKYQDTFPKETDEQLLRRYQRDQAAIMFNTFFGKKGIGHA